MVFCCVSREVLRQSKVKDEGTAAVLDRLTPLKSRRRKSVDYNKNQNNNLVLVFLPLLIL